MEFLTEYGLFLAKVATFVVAAIVLVSIIVSATQKDRDDHEGEGELKIRKLNDQYRRLKESIQARLMTDQERKAWQKKKKKEDKAEKKAAKKQPESDATEEKTARVYVLDFDGDIKASDTDTLRRSVSAVLSVANPETDEVVIRLESGGGLVHAYGLAAAQLDRVRSKGIKLTACVDKVAASGGYMMACVADRIIASPFAVLGSIGVVAQLPNFHRVLKKHDVDYEMLTAGEYKRTLTLFGENTEKGREKFQEDLENIHRLFKQFVSRYRPVLNVDEVATGEVWFGTEALQKALADEIRTSDEYISQRIRQADVFEVHFHRPKKLQDRLSSTMSAALDRLLLTWVSRLYNQRFW